MNTGVYHKEEVFWAIFAMSFTLNCILPIFPTYTNGIVYHVLVVSLLPVFFLPFFFKANINDLILIVMFFSIFLLATIIPIANNLHNISEFISGFKIVYFLLYVIVGYVFGYAIKSPIKRFEKLYFSILIVSVLVSIVELSIPSVSYFLYKRAELDILSDKLTSLFNTTYHYAFFLFWGGCFYLSKLFYSVDERLELKLYIINVAISLAILGFILMTQSRNFILISLFLVFIKTFTLVVKRVHDIKMTISVVIVVLMFLLLVYFFFTEIESRFSYVVHGINYLFSGGVDFSGGGSGSFNTRINQIIFAWDSISSNPFFGAGVGKDLYLESIYAYLLYKYGLIGLVTFFIVIIILSYLSKKNEIMVKYLNDKIFFNSCFWFFSLSPFYFLSGPLFEVPKLSMFFYCLIGLLLGYSRSYKMRCNTSSPMNENIIS